MNDTEIIEILRQICGNKTDTGYYLDVDGVQVPNFVGTDHESELPEIIIRPFIYKDEMVNSDIFCGEDDEMVKSNLKFNHARFQIDVFSKNLVQLLKIKTKIEERVEDFTEVELIIFTDNIGWELYAPNTYVNDYYDSSSPIVRITDSSVILTKCTTLEEVDSTNGSWYLDDTGLYINPLDDVNETQLYQLLNGLVLPDGNTSYDAGIHTFSLIQSSKSIDEDPSVERWTMEYIISYRTLRRRNLGDTVEEAELDVEEN